jgi:methylenetetrahydrofolate reductase (NADPH)
MEARLWETIRRLEPLKPSFGSVTYGAAGSTRDRTRDTVLRIANETTIPAAAHLSCIGMIRDEVDEMARHYWQDGVRHIVALRGDPPEGMAAYVPHPDGYASAVDLIKGLRRIADFEISVAAFPEIHPEAQSPDADIDYLKRKIDAGATRAITQYFFDIDLYLRFVERVRARGITAPIVPGIMPVFNFTQLARFSANCGASIPVWLKDMFEGLDDDPETRHSVAVAQTVQLCTALQAQGVNEFHFFSMNRADLVLPVCRMLGLRP